MQRPGTPDGRVLRALWLGRAPWGRETQERQVCVGLRKLQLMAPAAWGQGKTVSAELWPPALDSSEDRFREGRGSQRSVVSRAVSGTEWSLSKYFLGGHGVLSQKRQARIWERDRQSVPWEPEVATLIFSVTYRCPVELTQTTPG